MNSRSEDYYYEFSDDHFGILFPNGIAPRELSCLVRMFTKLRITSFFHCGCMVATDCS